ncbi:ATP-binding protein [Kitasatospora xanthocidica]|uniref:ATP-binding protein n=1 Tax=Kitasatospora xanthocidica TaxID=83382 RepID=UPI0036EE5CD8
MSREAAPPFTEEEIPLTTADIDGRPTGALAEDVLRHWVRGRPLSFRLPSLVRAVPVSRRLAGLWLDAEGVRAGHTRDAVLLVISELVTNALEHSNSTHITAWLRRSADRLLLEVRDQGKTSEVPQLHRATPDEDHGRGLALVADYSQDWGVRLGSDGSCSVWASVPLSGRSAAAC